MRRPLTVAVLVAGAAQLGACGSASSSNPSPTPTATAVALVTPTPTPLHTAKPVPPGPYAVLVTNSQRQGTTYDVLIVDIHGAVVARTTAQLPLLKPHQSVDLPLVAASNDRAYYLDGDTVIHSLAASGATEQVKSIADGQARAITFAVSPDNLRIAVATLQQQDDVSKSASHGYVEDIADTGSHVDLFSNTGSDAFRWPVAWYGSSIIDALSPPFCNSRYGPYAGNCPTGYHVVAAATGSRVASVCEAAPPQTGPTYDYYNVQGLPTSAGIACSEGQGSSSGPGVGAMLAVDWGGHERQFLKSDAYGNLSIGGCFLAPDGTRMACSAYVGGAVTLVAANGSTHNLGRRYTILSWIDSTHLMVQVDANNLGVLSQDDGSLAPLALTGADTVQMAAAIPGATP